MLTNKRHSLIILVVLVALAMFHAFNNYLVIKHSQYLTSPDSTDFFANSLKLKDLLTNFSLDNEWRTTFSHIIFKQRKPPLFLIPNAILMYFNTGKNMISFGNSLIYFPLLLFSAFAIGRRMHGYIYGLFLALTLSLLPTTFALSRIPMLDFALAAWTSLIMYLFLENRFKNLKCSILISISIMAGTLTKQSFFVFLTPILIHSIYKNIRNNNFKDKIFLKHYIYSILSPLLISILYYLATTGIFPVDMYGTLTPRQNPYFFYFHTMFRSQAGTIISVLFIISCLFQIWKKNYYHITAFLFCITIFSLANWHFERFVFPAYIFFAIILTESIWSMKILKKTTISLLSIYLFLSFFLISYANVLPENIYKYHSTLLLTDLRNEHPENGLYSVLRQGSFEKDWEKLTNKIISHIKALNMEDTITILQICDQNPQNDTLEYLLLKKGINVVLAWDNMIDPIAQKRWESINNFDFIAVQDSIDNQTGYDNYVVQAFKDNKKIFNENIGNFRLITAGTINSIRTKKGLRFYDIEDYKIYINEKKLY